MTRFLSEALSAQEPDFRLGMTKLEAAHGSPNHDIRLTGEIHHKTALKSLELGLSDELTNTKDLYRALQLRLANDEAKLIKKLRTTAAHKVSADGNVVAGMVEELRALPATKQCFAIRNSSLKRLLKDMPPKKAMRQLGYRSVESFLKHESPTLILAAAHMTEGLAWRNKFTEQYKKLKSSDFETRRISLVMPSGERWQKFSAQTLEVSRNNLISLREVGTIVFLDLPKDVPGGAVTISLSLALNELNHIRSDSTLLKLSQVRPDFGEIVKQVARQDLEGSYSNLEQPISWRLIHQYYSRLGDRFRQELFEPHLLQEDIIWEPIEKSLASIAPNYSFWNGTHHLAAIDDHKPVSLNIMDVAINYCNSRDFEHRIDRYLQSSIWHELLLRYLKRDKVEQTVLMQLEPKMATVPVLA